MRRLFVLLSVSAALGSGLLAADPALATPQQVIQDCTTHLRLTHTYSASELSQALVSMPSDVKAYTNCYDIISQALSKALASRQHPGSGSGSGSGGSFLPTPLIVVLVVLVLGAAGFGIVALRKRGGGGE
jgi:hypothetical protein